MTVVTRGFSRRSRLAATAGFGRSVAQDISQLVGQIGVLAGRVFSVSLARSWSVELQRTFAANVGERVLTIVATTRTGIVNLTRSFATWLARVFSTRGDE